MTSAEVQQSSNKVRRTNRIAASCPLGRSPNLNHPAPELSGYPALCNLTHRARRMLRQDILCILNHYR